MNWIIIRNVITNKTNIVAVPTGITCPADPHYRWAGFFASRKAASDALIEKNQAVYAQLFGPPRAITGTPGPESLSKLFRA